MEKVGDLDPSSSFDVRYFFINRKMKFRKVEGEKVGCRKVEIACLPW